jgi:hypothetical protein
LFARGDFVAISKVAISVAISVPISHFRVAMFRLRGYFRGYFCGYFRGYFSMSKFLNVCLVSAAAEE